VGNGTKEMQSSNRRLATIRPWVERSISRNIEWWFAHMMPMVTKLIT